MPAPTSAATALLTYLDDEAVWLTQVRDAFRDLPRFVATVDPQLLLEQIRRYERLVDETERRKHLRATLHASWSGAASRGAGDLRSVIDRLPAGVRPTIDARRRQVQALAEEVARLSAQSRGLVRVCLSFGEGLLERWTGAPGVSGAYTASGERAPAHTRPLLDTES